jgi:large subunit ribosomal protein L30
MATKSAAKSVGASQLKVTLLRSKFGQLRSIAASVSGLGLRRRHQSVLVADTAENRGMINAASHMLKVEEAK